SWIKASDAIAPEFANRLTGPIPFPGDPVESAAALLLPATALFKAVLAVLRPEPEDGVAATPAGCPLAVPPGPPDGDAGISADVAEPADVEVSVWAAAVGDPDSRSLSPPVAGVSGVACPAVTGSVTSPSAAARTVEAADMSAVPPR